MNEPRAHYALHRVAREYGIPLLCDTIPDRSDDQAYSPYAHWCEDGIVRYETLEPATLYSITHEMAHCACGPDAPEEIVLRDQATLLALFARYAVEW